MLEAIEFNISSRMHRTYGGVFPSGAYKPINQSDNQTFKVFLDGDLAKHPTVDALLKCPCLLHASKTKPNENAHYLSAQQSIYAPDGVKIKLPHWYEIKQ